MIVIEIKDAIALLKIEVGPVQSTAMLAFPVAAKSDAGNSPNTPLSMGTQARSIQDPLITK